MARRHGILVVDDEPDVVQSVRDLLRLDYRVFGATRAAEGLDILKREEIHVVMSDQRMPGTTGVEFLRSVKGADPMAIRLLFTGYSDIRAVIDAINEGNVYRYITKPWDPEELQTVIREACDRFDLIVERNQLLDNLTVQNATLARANEELRQSDELKRAFIQVASHELRTPLSILLGLSKLASRAPGLGSPVLDWIQRIDKAGLRLQRLVDDLVTMLTAGQYNTPLNRHPTDLAVLLHQAIDDVRPFAEIRKLSLVVDLPPDLPVVELDGLRIRDCLNHLLLNAVKFTPDGGSVTLWAKAIPQDRVEITVRDTGVGMDAESVKRVFEPFFTNFDVSRHSSGSFEFGRKGLGLGLSVVKAFVEMHGGKVSVASEVGHGSTFTLTLPLKAPAPAAIDNAPVETAASATPSAPVSNN